MRDIRSNRLFPALLRCLDDYGLSLSAVDYALSDEREGVCPFVRLLKPTQKVI